MNKLIPTVAVGMALLYVTFRHPAHPVAETSPPLSSLITGQSLSKDGKFLEAPAQENLYEPSMTRQLGWPAVDSTTLEALENQQQLFDLRPQKRSRQLGDLKVTGIDLEQTAEKLIDSGNLDHFEAYQIAGEDGKGHVKFTGYYTPVIQVRRRPDAEFQYPIYAFPKNWKGKLPTRRQIEAEGALAGKGLELAYAKSKVDIYYMQVQGSSYVEYPDGKRELLAYAATNRHPFRSIGKHMADREDINIKNISIDGIRKFFKKHPELVDSILYYNPSYTFFTRQKDEPKGAGYVPLTARRSIAVDPRYIPLGSTLLAAIPVLNNEGKVSHHEYQLLFAQDIGGAIKGPGHIDLYFGIGEEGEQAAGAMHHYGKVWLLLPKNNAAVAMDVR